METKNYKITETNIPLNFSMLCTEITTLNDAGQPGSVSVPNVPVEQMMFTNPSVTPFAALIATCADVISNEKFKPASGKAALLFSKKEDKEFENMQMAVVSELIKEDDEEEGNWNFYFTFNPAEFRSIGIAKEDIHLAYNQDDLFSLTENGQTIERSFVNRFVEALQVIGLIGISDYKAIIEIADRCIRCIKNWLDENAKEDEIMTVTIEAIPHPDMNVTSIEEQNGEIVPFATASVRIVKGIKEMSMTFSEELKLICKGNADSYVPFNVSDYTNENYKGNIDIE